MAPPKDKKATGPWSSRKGKAVNPKAPTGAGGIGTFKGAAPIKQDRKPDRPLAHPDSPVGRNTAPIDSARDTSVPPPPALDMRAMMKERGEKLVGQRVIGDGECYAMVDIMLTEGGAKTAHDFGKITTTADYKWGKLIPLSAVQPGDVLQFRDHVIVLTTKISIKGTQTDGRLFTQPGAVTETLKRGHHTSVVLAVNPDGSLEVAEQHVLDHTTDKLSTTIRKNTLYIKDGTSTNTIKTTKDGAKVEITTTMSWKVKGTIWPYQPLEK